MPNTQNDILITYGEIHRAHQEFALETAACTLEELEIRICQLTTLPDSPYIATRRRSEFISLDPLPYIPASIDEKNIFQHIIDNTQPNAEHHKAKLLLELLNHKGYGQFYYELFEYHLLSELLEHQAYAPVIAFIDMKRHIDGRHYLGVDISITSEIKIKTILNAIKDDAIMSVIEPGKFGILYNTLIQDKKCTPDLQFRFCKNCIRAATNGDEVIANYNEIMSVISNDTKMIQHKDLLQRIAKQHILKLALDNRSNSPTASTRKNSNESDDSDNERSLSSRSLTPTDCKPLISREAEIFLGNHRSAIFRFFQTIFKCLPNVKKTRSKNIYDLMHTDRSRALRLFHDMNHQIDTEINKIISPHK